MGSGVASLFNWGSWWAARLTLSALPQIQAIMSLALAFSRESQVFSVQFQPSEAKTGSLRGWQRLKQPWRHLQLILMVIVY